MSFLDLKLNNINYQLGVLTAQAGRVNVANTQANSVFYPMFCPTFGSIQPVSINQVGLTYRPNTDTLTSTGLVSSSLSSATITTSKITGQQSFSLNAATGMSVGISGTAIGISLTTPNANNFSVGQKVIVQGNDNAYFNGVEYTITQINTVYILQTNNPTGIPALEVGGGGTVSGGIITTRDLTATNLNGKLNIVGGTSNSGNVILCNNTTSTTGNFDLLTDSNQHLRFAGGSNVLTIGGATNGAISIPSTAGTITMANTGSILCNNLKNSGSGENLNLTAFTSGVPSSLTFNATSSNNASASGRYGYINAAGWHFENGDTTNELLAGINKYGFFVNNCGYIIRGDKFNALTSTSYWNAADMVIWNNATSVLAIANSAISFGLKGVTNTSFNFHSTAPSNYFAIQCQGGGSTAYLYVMSQPANTGVQLTTSAPNGWVSTSDRRLKKNVEDIPDALSSLLKLRPVSFDFISNPDGRKCVGFVAQEIQEIPLFDYLVMDTGRTGENEDTPYLGIAITDFIPYSVKAIQEQNKLITDQQKQIDNQQKQIDELKLLVNQLLNK
jgi:hypothetical protein